MLKSMVQKVKTSPFPFNRFLLLAILLIYISISHVFLPLFNKSDFLFFFKWNMFSSMPLTSVYDITWDEGQSFLFKDHRQKAKAYGINTLTLFYFLMKADDKRIKKFFYSQLMDFCKCQKIEIFKLQGSLADHIIYKKQLKIQTQKQL